MRWRCIYVGRGCLLRYSKGREHQHDSKCPHRTTSYGTDSTRIRAQDRKFVAEASILGKMSYGLNLTEAKQPSVARLHLNHSKQVNSVNRNSA
jgi:hypothetical protein